MVWQKVTNEVDGEMQEYWWDPDTDQTSWTTPEGVVDGYGDDSVTEISGPATHTAGHDGKTAQQLMTDLYGVYFRLKTGVKVLVEGCRVDMTVKQFKDEIENYEQGIPAFMQRLSFEGQPLQDFNTLGFYSIGPNCVVHLNEKSKDQIEFDEVGSRKVVGEMGRIKTSAVGMNGFYGCMCFSVVCLAVGIPILVIATFVNQWAAFECVRGAAVELSPCDGVDDTYYCPVSLQPSCSGIPSNCSVSLNTTSLSTDDQQTLYDMAETDVVTVYCCVDEFWCTADLYNSSLADGSAFIFDLLSAEEHQIAIYAAWGVIGVGLLSFLVAIIFVIAVAATKKYAMEKKVHVINTRQKGLVVGD